MRVAALDFKRKERRMRPLVAMVLLVPGLALPVGAAHSPVPAGSGSQNLLSTSRSGSKQTHSTSSHLLASKRSGRTRRSVHRRWEPTQMAPASGRIQEIQSALARSGYYQGETTGKWDGPTVDAMKRFQQANALSPTGKLDAPSLQRLGLGSEIAGVGAPRPAAPPEPAPREN
jgi:hypothetical protein